jgi:hypothetical protein
VLMVSFGKLLFVLQSPAFLQSILWCEPHHNGGERRKTRHLRTLTDLLEYSAATNQQTGDGVAIKKVTNVFSKKILAKRALREIKLLQHFRGT